MKLYDELQATRARIKEVITVANSLATTAHDLPEGDERFYITQMRSALACELYMARRKEQQLMFELGM